MRNPTGYSIVGYGDMIASLPRMNAYADALRHAVHPGCTVLDIGAGTGVFSLLACKYGAGEVHAVEPNDAIELARKIAIVNGYADRIIFHKTISTAVRLSKLADVVISDLRGVLPLFQNHINSIIDARGRLLASNGVLIPRRDTLWVSLLEDSNVYRPYAEPWVNNDLGLDLSAGQPLVVNTVSKANAKADQLLVESRIWATLDYDTIESADVSGEVTWTLERSGTAHGLLIWFDADLSDGLGFSNAPGEMELVYGQTFFPFSEPVTMSRGDVVSITLQARLVEDDYLWRWETRITAANDAMAVARTLRQSTFYGAPIPLERLKQREAGYIPPSVEGVRIDQFALSLLDGRTSLGEMADALGGRFPTRFARRQDALIYAADLSERYK